MKAWPQPYTNRVCVLVCDLLLAGLLGGAGAWLYIASQAHASSGLIHYACADSPQTRARARATAPPSAPSRSRSSATSRRRRS